MLLAEARLNIADQAALGKLFEEHGRRLLAQVRRRLDPALSARIDADDILNKAFLRAIQGWTGFQRSGMPAYPWLQRLVWQTLCDEYDFHGKAIKRDYHKDVHYPDDSADQLPRNLAKVLAGPQTTPSEALERKQHEQHLAEVLALLRPAEQEILRLLYLDNLPLADVAQTLSITEGTARQRHRRALGRAKDLWKERYGTEGWST